MKKVILKGPRVTLRPIELTDAQRYVQWFKDKKVIKYLALQTGFTLADERKYIKALVKKKDELNLAIITEKGEHIGGSGTTFDTVNKKADIGLVIGDVNSWGKGYGTEAMKLIVDYVLNTLKYNRIELIVSMDNKAAIKVYKKVGFKLEGIKRQSHWNLITRKYEDEGVMSILRTEWKKSHS